MVITVFRARVRNDLSPASYSEIERRNTRMLELASNMPGFISYKDFSAGDGEMLAIVEFDKLENVRVWQAHPEHREAQRWGRESVFAEYTIHTSEVVRTMRFP